MFTFTDQIAIEIGQDRRYCVGILHSYYFTGLLGNLKSIAGAVGGSGRWSIVAKNFWSECGGANRFVKTRWVDFLHRPADAIAVVDHPGGSRVREKTADGHGRSSLVIDAVRPQDRAWIAAGAFDQTSNLRERQLGMHGNP